MKIYIQAIQKFPRNNGPYYYSPHRRRGNACMRPEQGYPKPGYVFVPEQVFIFGE